VRRRNIKWLQYSLNGHGSVVCRATPAKAQAAQSHPESDGERAGGQIGQQLEVALPLHPYATHLDGFDRLLLQVIRIRPGIPYLPSKSMPSESLAALENPGSIG
jgi:hypothetical protein